MRRRCVDEDAAIFHGGRGTEPASLARIKNLRLPPIWYPKPGKDAPIVPDQQRKPNGPDAAPHELAGQEPVKTSNDNN